MNEIKLPVELVNAVLNYLGKQPYADVFTLVQALQQKGQEQLGSQPAAAADPAQPE